MTNSFVEYFQNLRRIFTEKNAWYRILVLLIIGDIYRFCTLSVKEAVKNNLNGVSASVSVPIVILLFLCGILYGGYNLLIFSNRMNKKDNLVPKIDFLDMFVTGLKGIPFFLVWSIYYILAASVIGITVVLFLVIAGGLLHFMHIPQSVIFILLMILSLPVVILLAGPWVSIIALFSKDFSYKKVLNPLLYFKLFPKTAFKIGGAYLGVIAIVLALVLAAAVLFLPATMVYRSLQPEMQFILLTITLFLIGYIGQVIGIGLSCSIADITYEAVGDESITSEPDKKSDDNDVVDVEYENSETNE